MIVNRITASALAASLALGIFAVPAAAAGPVRTVTVTATAPARAIDSGDTMVRYVGYRDLNLVDASGERTLLRRVRHAVSEVCGYAGGGTLGALRETVQCKDKSWAGASPQVDLALQRARDIAANGFSAIAPVAIRISVQ